LVGSSFFLYEVACNTCFKLINFARHLHSAPNLPVRIFTASWISRTYYVFCVLLNIHIQPNEFMSLVSSHVNRMPPKTPLGCQWMPQKTA
jgi:hypothetical protein